MKFQLRLEEAAGRCVGSKKNELGILTPPRIELQRPADICTQALIATNAARQSHEVFDRVRKILQTRHVTSMIQQGAAQCLILLHEGSQYAAAPVVIRHERDRAHVTIGKRAFCC